MKAFDRTDMGGDQETFLTTHWSMIEGLQSERDQDHALIELLLKRYWKPVYVYIRQKGHGNEDAKDLTQGFFHEVVLNRHLVERADQSKGRFRSFLLYAVNQYLIDCRRKETAQKRIPKEKLIPLDALEIPVIPDVLRDADPDACFHHVWKSALLEHALSRLEAVYTDLGMEVHWKVFRDRVVHPALTDCPCPSIEDLCAGYGIEDKATASNMIMTVKRRFRTILRDCVQETVSRDDLVEGELSEILHLFRKDLQDRKNPAD